MIDVCQLLTSNYSLGRKMEMVLNLWLILSVKDFNAWIVAVWFSFSYKISWQNILWLRSQWDMHLALRFHWPPTLHEAYTGVILNRYLLVTITE